MKSLSSELMRPLLLYSGCLSNQSVTSLSRLTFLVTFVIMWHALNSYVGFVGVFKVFGSGVEGKRFKVTRVFMEGELVWVKVAKWW